MGAKSNIWQKYIILHFNNIESSRSTQKKSAFCIENKLLKQIPSKVSLFQINGKHNYSLENIVAFCLT